MLCAFLLLIGAVIGSNVAVSQGQAVSGCVNKKTGILRISEDCSKSEKKIQWNTYGIQGEKGEQGQAGERGPQGRPGSTLLSGEGIPSAFAGEDGDFYIDLKTYIIYGPKKNDSWGFAKALTGPAGAPGAQGVKGDRGDIGAPGATGSSGLSKTYFDYTDLSYSHSGAGLELCYTTDFLLPSGNFVVVAYVEADYDIIEDRGGAVQMAPRVGIGANISEPIRGTTVPEFGIGSVTLVWTFRSVAPNSPVDFYCDSSGGIEFRTLSLVAIGLDTIVDLP